MRWSPEDNVRWKTELPGNGWSSPVVQAGRIYVTAAIPLPDSDDLSLRLIELDGRSGVVVRSSEVFRQDADSAPAIHSKNSHASPTPVIEGDRIYVHFGHQGTACYDLSGQPILKNATIVYDPQHGNGGSPILVGEHLMASPDIGATIDALLGHR